ncbi:hypothetical protein INQ51_02845 [Maribellus sp. CM-23]|uniref:hypothetical protein n=1 Tax=Maribellus sp. CM-23 TaxID=2781026 RepID=UPI001F24BD43|nr:hypothetical protein [Maribellus sp. CM-23]MCE4563238.1 hypothetical protein [Maribellus sp. CM-23]
MKKSFLLSIVFYLAFAGVTFAQSNKVGTGSNFYNSFFTKSLAISSSTGPSALVYVDYSFSDDGVVLALNNKGYTVTVATSWSDFNTKLAAGTDLAVAFAQNNSASGSLNLTTVQNYITGGGKMIFASWATGADQAYANLFEAEFTGNTNLNNVTVSNPLIANELTTNPYALSNPGWTIFSTGLAPIGNGIVAATFENDEAAIIIGNNGNTIMLGYLSDTPAGDANNRANVFASVLNGMSAPLTVPVSMFSIILVFMLIALSVVITKRKAIFS